MADLTRFIRRMSVQGKLALLVFLTSSVALLFAGSVFSIYQIASLRGDLERDVSTLAGIVAEQSGRSLLRPDRTSVENMLQALRRDEHIISAFLYSPEGSQVAAYRRRTAGEGATWDYDDPPRGLGGQYMVLSQPVVAEGREVGTLYVQTDLDGVYDRVLRDGVIGASVMLASFFIAFLVSRRVQGEISGPVQDLVTQARAALGGHRYEAPAPQRDRDDELGVLVGAFTGLVDQVRRRDADLRQSERQFRSLIENASDVVTLVDREGIVRYQSPAGERLLGLAADSLLGSRMLDLVHEADRTALSQGLDDVQTSRERRWLGEIRLRTAGGDWRVVEVAAVNRLDDPAVAGVVLTARDIAERQRAEAALRDSDRRFREVVEHAADAFFLLGEDGRILDVNQESCESLGYSRDELLAMTMGDIDAAFHPDQVAGPDETRRVTVQGHHLRKDGVGFPVELRIGRFESAGRRLMVALARNMVLRERVSTELKKAKEAAESADRFKSRFLANISHEIRTPMTAVLGMTDLLQRSELSAEQARYVEIARSSGDALLSVIDDILELSWMDSGQVVLDSLDFDLHALVEEVLDPFAQRAQAKGLELAAVVENDVPRYLRGDPRHLRQVLLNLLGNAVKFTERGTVDVRVTLEQDDEVEPLLRFTIRDTGIGVPESLQAKLFEPFSKAEILPARRTGGTGVGLAISRALVAMMGGEVGVDSQPGQGASFWFTGRIERRVPATRDTGGRPILTGVRALVVDDNATARVCLRDQLEGLGVLVRVAERGVRALETLRRCAAGGEPIDLAMIDYGMPGMDGAVLARAIRADPGLATTRLVMLTSLADTVDTAELRELKIDAQVTKPIKQSRLGDVLEGLLVATPVTDPAESLASYAASAQDPRGRRRTDRPIPQVLVADDDRAVRQSMALMLGAHGYRVEVVADGHEVLAAMGETRFDLVVLDCQMPELDGYETTRRIRQRAAQDGFENVPIIGISGYTLDGERERCLEAGMDEFLTKPIPMAMLAAVMESCLSASGVG
jgi:PAS domain S-box-containing protein